MPLFIYCLWPRITLPVLLVNTCSLISVIILSDFPSSLTEKGGTGREVRKTPIDQDCQWGKGEQWTIQQLRYFALQWQVESHVFLEGQLCYYPGANCVYVTFRTYGDSHDIAGQGACIASV